MVSSGFVKQISGYGLATAHILYHLPDHPSFLQAYIWQDYDLCPHFPELNKFLEFWNRELEGKLHSVQVGHQQLIKPAEMRVINGHFLLN